MLPFFPINWSNRCYIEPFCGSLSVFFNVNPKSAVLNDANKELVNFWVVVSDPLFYEGFLNLLKRSVYSIEYINKLNKSIECKTDTNNVMYICKRALLYYLKNRMSFSGFNEDKPSDIVPNRNILHANLDKWHSYFENADVRIWHKDFREVFKRIETTSDKWVKKFIYCDPPYVKAGSAYKHLFEEQDHRDLSDCLHKTKFEWVLSYDENPLIRELYREYKIVPIQWHYSCAGGNTIQKPELLITNRMDNLCEV